MKRIVHFLALAAVAAALACDTIGGEGDRCNPLRSSDECDQGLACTTPDFCGYSVCCPVNFTSQNPMCAACPAPDSGAPSNDAGVDNDSGSAADGGSDATTD